MNCPVARDAGSPVVEETVIVVPVEDKAAPNVVR
jgi:hypothetical protein